MNSCSFFQGGGAALLRRSPEPAWRRASRSVVRLECGGSTGTGFLVDPQGLFLTAAHVVDGIGRIGGAVRLRRFPWLDVTGAVCALDSDRDLALIEARLPENHGLRLAAFLPITRPLQSSRLVAFHMLDPQAGFAAAIETATAHVGTTAIQFGRGTQIRTIDRVWSLQGLTIEGGTSGAPAVDPTLAAVVAVTSAGADAERQAFFVPLGTASATNAVGEPSPIRGIVVAAADRIPRLGSFPNRPGLAILAWLATRQSARTLIEASVYDPARALIREQLLHLVDAFLKAEERVALLSGVSGVGKTSSLIHLARRRRLDRPVVLLRAAQMMLTSADLPSPLLRAVARQIGVPDLDMLPSAPDAGPLLVLDGFNEFPPPFDGQRLINEGQVAALAKALGDKGWKVLITTRGEVLHQFNTLARTTALFDPKKVPARDSEDEEDFLDAFLARIDEAQSLDLPDDGLFKLPAHIRLEAFDRNEFDRVRESYALSPTLPYSVFRHPIVLRLAAQAQNAGALAEMRVTGVLGQYFVDVVDRIQTRLPGNSREWVADHIEQLTALRIKETLGYVPHEALPAEDRALAEAAVMEGLLEHVPGGYRYVYDEVYEYVRARTLAPELPRLLGFGGRAADVLASLLSPAASPALIARALELAPPNSLADFARKLSGEILAEKPPQSLAEAAQIVARTSKDAALDPAKEALCMLADRGGGNAALQELSEDYMSYAFSIDQIWRFVRASTRLDESRDSYPFRYKDLRDEAAVRWAYFEVRSEERFAALRHLLNAWPDIAAERLLAGLGDKQPMGREHTFSSFCAQVIAAFSKLFDFASVIKAAGAKGRSMYLFEVMAQGRESDVLDSFLRPEMGFIDNQQTAVGCLYHLQASNPSCRRRTVETAIRLVLEMGHPVQGYGWAVDDSLDRETRVLLKDRANAAWQAGTMTPAQLADFCLHGLFTFDEVVAMFTARLDKRSGHAADRPDVMTLDLITIVRAMRDHDRTEAIDQVAAAIIEHPSGKLRERAGGAEHLLHACDELGIITPRLERLVIDLLRADEKEAIHYLRYVCFGIERDGSRKVAERLAALLVEHAANPDNVFDAILWGCSKDEHHSILPIFIEQAANRHGTRSLYDWCSAHVDSAKRNVFTAKQVRGIAKHCTRLGHREFKPFLEALGDSDSED